MKKIFKLLLMVMVVIGLYLYFNPETSSIFIQYTQALADLGMNIVNQLAMIINNLLSH